MTKVGWISLSSTVDSNSSKSSLPPSLFISSLLMFLFSSRTRSVRLHFLKLDKSISSLPHITLCPSLISSEADLIIFSVNSIVFSSVVKAS